MSEKILIIGKRSKIAKEFLKKVKNVDVFCPVKKSWDMKNLNFKSHQIKKITSADKILLLQAFIEDRLSNINGNLDIDDINYADSIINITAVNSELYDEINQLGPFGSNNEEPNFIIKSTKITFIKEFGDNHIRCGLSSDIDKNIEGITFRSKNTPLGDSIMNNKGNFVSLYGKIKVNEWGGRRIPQFHIEDIGKEIK